MMRKAILSLMLVMGVIAARAQDITDASHDEGNIVYDTIHVNWQNSFKQALAKSKLEGKPILIYFTGSDWCGPCVELDKKLFHTQKFVDFATENLILYTANYPRNSDLVTAETKKINDQLSKKYNQSSFPTMLIIDKKGKVLGKKEGAYMSEYYYPFFEKVVKNHNKQ